MGYQVLDPETVDPMPDRPCLRRSLSDATALSSVAINVYEASPGEQIPAIYHYHDEQEEAFYVLDGELAVETPDREYTVGTNELFVADPGSPHRAYNPADAAGPVRLLAVGAPPAADDAHPYEPDS